MSETHRDTLKIALSGGPARQKTRQIAHLIREFGAEKVGILSCEAGLNTIASSLPGVKVWPVAGTADMRLAWSDMAAFCKTPDVWLCIDGGTTMLTWYEQDIWQQTDRCFEVYIKNGKDAVPADLKPFLRFISTKKETIDPFAVYAAIGRRVCELYTALLRLDCNFYINFMEEKIGKADGEKTLPYGPEIPGQVGKSFIIAKTDFIGHLHFDPNDPKRTLLGCWNPGCSTHQTKTRNEQSRVEIPPEIPEFDLGKFVRLIQPAG